MAEPDGHALRRGGARRVCRPAAEEVVDVPAHALRASDRNERGTGSVEYGLLVVGVAIAAVIGVGTIGTLVSDSLRCVEATLADHGSAPADCPDAAPGPPNPSEPLPSDPAPTDPAPTDPPATGPEASGSADPTPSGSPTSAIPTTSATGSDRVTTPSR